MAVAAPAVIPDGGTVTIAAGGTDTGGGGGRGRQLPDPMRMVPAEVHGLPSLDLRAWGGPTKTHLEQFDDLERRGYLKLAGVGYVRIKSLDQTNEPRATAFHTITTSSAQAVTATMEYPNLYHHHPPPQPGVDGGHAR